jgi:hypothetical protein
VAAICLILLREISLLLSSVEAQGDRAYGMSVLTKFRLTPWNADDISDAWAVWTGQQLDGLVRSLLVWHLSVDSFLILVYALTLFWVFRALGNKSRRPWVLIGALVAADLLENVLTVFLVVFQTPKFLAPLIAFASDAKWLLAILVLGTALWAWLNRTKPDPDDELAWHQWAPEPAEADASEEPKQRRATPQLRLAPQIVVVALFGALIALPGGGPFDQIPDVLRGSLDVRQSRFWVSLAAIPVLAAAVTVAARRTTLLDAPPIERHAGYSTTDLLLLAVRAALVLLGVSYFLDGPNVALFAAPIVLLLLLLACEVVPKVARWVSGREQPANTAQPGCLALPTHKEATKLHQWAGALAGLVVLFAGLGGVRATARPVLLNAGDVWERWFWFAGALVLTTVASAIAHRLVTWERAKEPWVTHVGIWGLGGLLAISTVLLVFWPGAVAPNIGTTSVIVVAFAVLAIGTGELSRFSLRRQVWAPLARMAPRLRRTPYWALILVTGLLAAALDRNSAYHDVRLHDAADYAHADLDAAWKKWLENQDGCSTDQKTRQMLLVAAPGGGIRAAYWTASTLDKVSDPCAGAVFAISSVSGGSLGAALWSYPVQKDQSATGSTAAALLSSDDGLSTATAGLVFRDLPRSFVPFSGGFRDRAQLLEDSWAADLEGMKKDNRLVYAKDATLDQLTGGKEWKPVMVYNGASAADGCRVITTNTAHLQRDEAACLAGPTGADTSAISGALNPRDDAIATRGELGAACTPATDQQPLSMRATTAALMSARFPYVSPAGTVRRCLEQARGPQEKADVGGDELSKVRSAVTPTYVVDGGYIENTGLLTLLQLWQVLKPMIESHNAEAGAVKVVPWIVVADNHYRSNASGANVERIPETTVPLVARLNARETLGTSALEQIATREMSVFGASGNGVGGLVVIAPQTAPSIAAPLGWVLSADTRAELDEQLTKQWCESAAGSPVERLRDALGASGC